MYTVELIKTKLKSCGMFPKYTLVSYDDGDCLKINGLPHGKCLNGKCLFC